MARYEIEGDKFWEVVVTGATLYTRYGKLGRDGRRSQPKTLASPEAAAREADKLAAAKVAQGYRAVSDQWADHPRNPALEAAIRRAPDEPAGYLVYGDWLQAQGDPRGELIAIQSARDAAPSDAKLAEAERALLVAHQDRFLPARITSSLARWGGKRAKSGGCAVTWAHGFLVAAEIGRLGVRPPYTVRELVQALLAHPSAAFLRSLTLGSLGTKGPHDYQPTVDAVIEAAPTSLHTLVIGDGDPKVSSRAPLADSRLDAVSGLAQAAPALRELRLRVGSPPELPGLALPSLTSLSVTCAGLHRATLAAVAACPSLSSLALNPGARGEASGAGELDIRALSSTLCRAKMPALRSLALTGTPQTGAALSALIQAPWWRALESLDLSDGTLDDSDVQRILSRKEAFAHLRALDVSRNILSSEAVASLAELGPEVTADDQHPPPGVLPPFTEQQVSSFANDFGSMDKGRKLAQPRHWETVGIDDGRLWGRCRGSSVYDVYADPSLWEAGCTCPSYRYPCKHALGLLYLAASDYEIPAQAAPPGFIENCQEARYDSVWE